MTTTVTTIGRVAWPTTGRTSHRVLPLRRTATAAALAGAAAVLPAAPATAALHGPAAAPHGPALRADQDTARVSGQIHSHYGSGWTVELIRPGETGPAHAVSTGSGTTFEFEGVPPGDYVLRAFHAESGTTGPETPVTLRAGDNGNMSLVFDGPPPDQLPDMLEPLTGRVRGILPGADVVVEVLHDRDGDLVEVSSAPVAEDGTFSVDPRTIENYALPIHLRAVRTLPDGSTRTVYHGGSPTPEGSVPIVPAEGVLEHYELVLPAASGTPGPSASAPDTAEASPAASPGEAAGRTGPPPAVWAAVAVAAVAAAVAVAVVLRRRAG